MDDNIFYKPPVDELQKEAGIEEDSAPVDPKISPPPQELPSEPPPSSMLRIFKIALGLVIVLGICIFTYTIILPKFFPGGINKTKITYWGINRDPAVMEPIIAVFEKEHPDIDVEYLKQDADQYAEKLVVRSNNGNGPDIFSYRNTWTTELLDLLLPLPDSVISEADFSSAYYPVAKTDLIRSGNIYGIPLGIDTLNLFVNNNLLQAAGLGVPATWEDFNKAARQLTVKDEREEIKTSGAAIGAYDNIANAPDILSMLFVQNGVKLNDIASNQPAVSDALTYYTSFASSFNNVWSDAMDKSIAAFASGSVGMYFGYSRDLLAIKLLKPDFSFSIHPVPSLYGQDITIANYWAEGVSNKTKHQKEALLFMQYLSKKETMQKLFEEQSKTVGFGEPYARVDLAKSLKDSPVYPFIVAAPSAVSSLFAGGEPMGKVSLKTNEYLRTAVNAILEGKAPKEATEELSAEVSPLLK